MNCEEFEVFGLDGDAGDRALAHADSCARCAALLERWQAARNELESLALLTRGAEAPARVEMRLRQEFRAARRPRVSRKAVVAAVWALAAAAAVAAVASWEAWKPGSGARPEPVAVNDSATPSTGKPVENAAPAAAAPARAAVRPGKKRGGAPRTTEVASQAAEPFSLLPGILPEDAQQTGLVKVRMRRAGLAALGLPVNEERAGDWIQVDMLVGYDGQPRAVRLDRSAASGSTVW